MKFKNIKELREFFVEDGTPLEINHKYLGSAGLNPFVLHNSSPRGSMMTSHISQIISIDNPEPSSIQTGLEREFGKYVIMRKLDKPIEVITVIDRYSTYDLQKSVEKLIIFRDLETGIIDAIDIPIYSKYHPYFGIKFDINPIVDNLTPGSILEEETILAKPPTLKDDGTYGFGRDVNVAFMTLPGVDEDGFIVSESFCKQFKYKLFDQRSIVINSDDVLLNIYGDKENFKPFPEIGERINETGVIIAKRRIDKMYNPALMSVEDLMDFDPSLDTTVYTRGPGGIVVDIKVHSNIKKKYLPYGTNKLLDKYRDALIGYYNRVIQAYENISKEYKRAYNMDVKIGHFFHFKVTEAYSIVSSYDSKYNIKKMYRKEPIGLYRIDFTIMYDMDIGVKNKISDFHGGKGTIVQVWKDEDMPIDKDGNRADIIAAPESNIARLIPGRLYERYFKAAMKKVEKYVREAVNEKGGLDRLKDIDVMEIFKIVVEFTDLLENNMSDVYRELLNKKRVDDMYEIIEEIVKDKFYIFFPVDNRKRSWEVAIDIINSRFRPTKDRVKFKYDGKEMVTEEPVAIAPTYIILLSKIADSGLATSSAKVNQFKLPIPINKNDKYSLPYRNTPVRFLGESETRVLTAFGGRYAIAELRNRSVSLDTHAMVYRGILNSEKPTDIDDLTDRSKHPFEGDGILNIIEALFESVGFGLEYVEDSERFRDYKDIEEEIIEELGEEIEDDDSDKIKVGNFESLESFDEGEKEEDNEENRE